MAPFRWFPSLLLVAAAAACTDPTSAPPADAPPSLGGPSLAPGAAGSYTVVWLRPTVRTPAPFQGTFAGDRYPVVRVTCIGAAGPGCPTVARFDRDSSHGPTRPFRPPTGSGITVNYAGESYHARWAAKGLTLGGDHYRLEVVDGGQIIGSANLWVVATRAEVAGVPSGYIGVQNDEPFAIVFRIESSGTVVTGPLAGPPGTPVGRAIPALTYLPLPGSYQLGHPEAPEVPLSTRDLTVSFHASATAGAVNQLLQSLAAEVVGGIPSSSTVAGGILVLRLPTSTHAEMEAALAVLRASPLVRAALQNYPVSGDALPTRSATAGTWTWEVDPQSGNWAFEAGRAPQLWHFNDRVQASGRRTDLLIFDRNFWPSHEDVGFTSILTPDSMISRTGLPDDDYHGTMVASVAHATFGNGRGIDGIDPFARLLAAHRHDDGAALIQQLADYLVANPTIRVVNVSFGFPWVTDRGSLAATPLFMTSAANEAGEIFRDLLLGLEAGGRPLPVIVASAGNDGLFNLTAPNNSFATNAGLRLGVAPVIVVEGLAQLGSARILDLAPFSNTGGHVSAGGGAVRLAMGGNTYTEADGTSFAAPFVAGLVSYLFALDAALPNPTMSTNPVRDLLIATGTRLPASVAQPAVDGYAAALALDARNGNQSLRKELADLDDGTLDGNERITPTGAPNPATTRARDGAVDIRDFRRFRDWYLQASGQGFNLDGAPDHPKKDLNGDGVVEATAAQENIFPRGDLNGDGRLDDTPAPFGSAGNLTDLGVMKLVFQDPDYQTADLDNLLQSGDVRIEPGSCPASRGATTVTTTVRVPGVAAVRTIGHPGPDQPIVMTVEGLGSATPYDVVVSGTDASGTEVFSQVTNNVVVDPGSDQVIRVPCPTITVVVSPTNSSVVPGGSVSFTATVIGTTNQAVTWSATGGTINSSGLYSAGQTAGTFSVTATSVADPSRSATVPVRVSVPVVVPPASVATQQLSLQPTLQPIPIRFRARVTSLPGVTVRWGHQAQGNGSGFLPNGPVAGVSFGADQAPTPVDQFREDWFAEATYVQGLIRPGVTVGWTLSVTACFFKPDGTPLLNAFGVAICQTVTNNY
ncbi:MAG: S8 family serine peptidase [Gemmatimonadales bacterium]|nr:S8 family serine peptidase [Gemmatimonadales bacterium]